MKLFNFGRHLRLSVMDVCEDEPPFDLVAIWLSGRVFGKYISITLPRGKNPTPLYSKPTLMWWNRVIDKRYRDYMRSKKTW